MRTLNNELLILTKKAGLLENRINQPLSKKQLWELAQEAANSYHAVVMSLKAEADTDREVLTKLSKTFSWIENEAIRKFYQHSHTGPTGHLL